MRSASNVRVFLVCATVVAFAAACGDSGSSPAPAEPSGRYTLTLVGDKSLPLFLASYLDGSHDELDHGSLRVLSRGRLLVAATTYRYWPDGSFHLALNDTTIFAYRRSGNIVVLTFDDPLGPRSDTLDMVTYSANFGLRARSANYIRAGWPAPMLVGALYVK